MSQLPDPISAEQAAAFPELLSLPALVTLGNGHSLWVRTFEHLDDNGAPEPFVRCALLREATSIFELIATADEVRGILAALIAAERSLVQLGAPR